jgi:hypothetical protein
VHQELALGNAKIAEPLFQLRNFSADVEYDLAFARFLEQ